MAHLITGVAGFIGSNLAKALLSQSETVIGIDNFHLGNKNNIDEILDDPNFIFRDYDLSIIDQLDILEEDLKQFEIESLWHLAANSDIQAGVEDPSVDLKLTFLTSYVSLELCRNLSAKNFIFASTSAVYGDMPGQLIKESSSTIPISNYGAMKLASEAMIGSHLEGGLERAFIFRFPNVVGFPATHGVIFDFVKKLKNFPDRLDVLGDGSQKKCYLHSDDLISAMLHCFNSSKDKGLHCFNLGPDDHGITVKSIAEKVVMAVSPSAKIIYGSGNKGWIGDVPSFKFDISKLKSEGWAPSMHSSEAIDLAIMQIVEQLK